MRKFLVNLLSVLNILKRGFSDEVVNQVNESGGGDQAGILISHKLSSDRIDIGIFIYPFINKKPSQGRIQYFKISSVIFHFSHTDNYSYI